MPFVAQAAGLRRCWIALACVASWSAAAAEPDTACRLGPWPIASTRESVQAQAEQGPFVPVAVTGGFETFNARFGEAPQNVSFKFDWQDRLQYMQHFVYEDKDGAVAKARFTALLAGWQAAFGGFKANDMRMNDTDVLPASAAEKLFQATVQVPVQAVAEMKDSVVVSVLFHAEPAKQPEGCNLHVLYGHIGRTGTFFVYQFIDRKDHLRQVPRVGITLDKP